MRRDLLIFVSLVFALVGWSTVCAQDGFYVIPVIRVVPKTGQTTIYAWYDDGFLEKGLAWPTPRFTNNGNGTVTDNLTRLIWMRNAQFFGSVTWGAALNDANGLKSGTAGLSDGSKVGDWRLPNIRELQSLVDYGNVGTPTLPVGHPFTGVLPSIYWSSTTAGSQATMAWNVNFMNGTTDWGVKDTSGAYVWGVRGGQ